MLSLTVIFTSVLLGLANAQNNSALTVPPGVDASDQNKWCIAERNVCPILCGSTMKTNNCLGTEVTKYQCVCGDDKTPDKIDQYIGSVPNSICIATFAYCRQLHPGSDSCVECGKLVPSQVAKAAASSTSSSSSSSTSAPSVTSAATSPTATKGAAVKLGGEIGGVAMGVAAAVGMFL